MLQLSPIASFPPIHRQGSFLLGANMKEGLMIAPGIYVIAGSCGVALLRRSGDYPNVLGAVVKVE